MHVSADNRYKLYVNGHLVSLGPARGDIYNWNYETVDLSPWLRQGDNTLAAEVWNFVEWKPIAQISFNQTGLIVQGNGPDEQGANTDGSWKCLRNDAYAPHTTGVYGYFAAGPGERVDASRYPWGWQQPDYDDSAWAAARVGMEGAAKGARDYPGRLLVPTPIPPMEYAEDRFSRVRQSENAGFPTPFRARRFDHRSGPHESPHPARQRLAHYGLSVAAVQRRTGLADHRRIRRSALYGHRPAVCKETGTRSKARNSSDTRTSFCPTAAATGCSRRFGGGRGVTCS